MSLNKLVLLLLMVTLSHSCQRHPFDVDTKGMNADLRIARFEQVLFSADPS